MDLFTQADLKAVLAEHQRPCVSLFMPAHRGGSEEDPIRFRKLLTKAEEQLIAHGLRKADARDFLEDAHTLLEDATFWHNQGEALAAFFADDFRRVFRLPCGVCETLVVGGYFHLLPLLPLVQADGRFFVLALSQNSVRLFAATHYAMHPVAVPGLPTSFEEAMKTHDRDEVLTFHTRPTSGGGWGAIFEGHGVGIDDRKKLLLRYCQLVDRGLHGVLRQERAPLVLAAVDYLLPIYREANTYALLHDEGIEGSPERLPVERLHQLAWSLVEALFSQQRQAALAGYSRAAAASKATEDISEVVPAAYRGEVETLYVMQSHSLWGTLNPQTNEVVLHDERQSGDDDLLNLAAVCALRHGNKVFVLPAQEMPTKQPLAAVFHLPLARHGKRR